LSRSALKILIAPDSFKGTLSAMEVAQAIAQGVRLALPQAELRLMPLADGGEGTLDAVLHACPGERRFAEVRDAGGKTRRAAYGVIQDNGTEVAVLEAAQIVGWGQLTGDVMQRTSYGLGELIGHCLDQNLRRFWIGLGGSSTNDGGLGLLQALGVRFYDAHRQAVAPTPSGLLTLQQVDWDHLDSRIRESQIPLFADVDNPLTGAQGATLVFGPQKGVAAEALARLDQAMAHFSQLGDAWSGHTVSMQAGAGAAGGLGYALMLCGAMRRAGAEALCELLHLEEALAHCTWVITGEGRTDAQTLHGKLPLVVAQNAQRAGVRTALLAGSIAEESRAQLQQVFEKCVSLVGVDISLEQAMQDPVRCLAQRAHEMMMAN